MSADVALGPFELGEKLGEGGMGTVYRARHRETDVDVAIKVISQGVDKDARQKFHREVQSHAGLVHPGIVYLFEYGTVPQEPIDRTAGRLRPGSPFVAMEFADAGTVRNLPDQRTWPLVRDVLRQVLRALAFAHSRNVLHRDLKPENLLVFDDESGRRRVKLADFGLAHVLGEETNRDAQTLAAPSGTPLYIAPEQTRGAWRRYGPWTDIYSLGCIAWELVSGRPPFTGDMGLEIMVKHQEEARPGLEPLFPVPDQLQEWIKRAMAVDPRHRFRRAADALRALERLDDFDDSPQSGASPNNGNRTREDEAPAVSRTQPLETQVEVAAATEQLDDAAEPGESCEDPFGQTKPIQYEIVTDEGPKVPDSWRTRAENDLPSDLVDTGLGLFGLRETPFVDRDDERDHVWEALREVEQAGAPRLVFVVGESGTGKSRLVEWMAARAHELGAARIMRATHSPGGESTGEGLAGMIRRTVRGQKLDRNELYDHLVDELPPLDQEAVDRESDARALTELVYPTDEDPGSVEGPKYRFSSVDQKCGLLARFVQRYSRDRPSFVWIDDAQWAGVALTLVEHLVESPFQQPPALVAVTLRSDVLFEKEWLQDWVAKLARDDDTSRFDLEPLESDDHRAFIERMLPLEPELTDRLAARTEGNPLFAKQLLGHLVEQDRLEVGARGFHLADALDDDLPDDIHGIWMKRLGRFVVNLEPEPSEATWQALERAAAMGRELHAAEWVAICEDVGVGEPESFRDELVERGLAERTETGWAFTHGLLVEALKRRARHMARWEQHNLRCVAILERLYADRPARTASRRANHYVEAEQLEKALEPLLVEVRRLERSGNIEHLKDMLERRKRLLDDLGVADSDPRRVENAIQLAHCRHRLGASPDDVLEELVEARNRADAQHDDVLVAEASHHAADCARATGNLDAARDHLTTAVTRARQSDDRELLAKVLIRLGWLEYMSGEPDRAESYFSEATRHATDGNLAYWTGVAKRGSAWAALSMGDQARAEELFESVLEASRASGHRSLEAQCLSGLADLAKMNERADRARSYYYQCRDLFRELNRAEDMAVTIANLAEVELMAGRFDAASEHLTEAKRQLHAIERTKKYRNFLRVARVVRAAGTGEMGEFDELMDHYADGWSDDARLIKDHPWLLEIAGDYAAGRDNSARARRAWELAAELWRRLGDEEAAEEVESKISHAR